MIELLLPVRERGQVGSPDSVSFSCLLRGRIESASLDAISLSAGFFRPLAGLNICLDLHRFLLSLFWFGKQLSFCFRPLTRAISSPTEIRTLARIGHKKRNNS
jgi:hypothetical protein